MDLKDNIYSTVITVEQLQEFIHPVHVMNRARCRLPLDQANQQLCYAWLSILSICWRYRQNLWWEIPKSLLFQTSL